MPESVERKLKLVLKLFILKSKDFNSFITLLKLKTQSQLFDIKLNILYYYFYFHLNSKKKTTRVKY